MHLARLHIAVSFLALAACANVPTVQYATDALPGRGLADLQPADVAVAPVRDESGNGAPVSALREACYHGLVDRLYSPVNLDYVDRDWTEAAFGSAGAAEAVFDVVVTTWDTVHVPSRGVVRAVAEVRMLDVRDPDGEPLWGARVTRRLSLGGPDPEGDWSAQAAGLLALEILGALPERDPVQANR